MIYRVVLSDSALRQLDGFPLAGMDAVTTALAAVVEDPHDGMRSDPTGPDPDERVTSLGGSGFVHFTVYPHARVVRVTDVIWVG